MRVSEHDSRVRTAEESVDLGYIKVLTAVGVAVACRVVVSVYTKEVRLECRLFVANYEDQRKCVRPEQNDRMQ